MFPNHHLVEHSSCTPDFVLCVYLHPIGTSSQATGTSAAVLYGRLHSSGTPSFVLHVSFHPTDTCGTSVTAQYNGFHSTGTMPPRSPSTATEPYPAYGGVQGPLAGQQGTCGRKCVARLFVLLAH